MTWTTDDENEQSAGRSAKPTDIAVLEELRATSVAGVDCLVTIYALDDHLLGSRHILENDIVNIGRDGDNDIVLDADSVSRRHAKIERRGGDAFLVDLDSTNGTFVNDV